MSLKDLMEELVDKLDRFTETIQALETASDAIGEVIEALDDARESLECAQADILTCKNEFEEE